MGKVQTQGKVNKVGVTFGLIWLLFRLGKVGKVEMTFLIMSKVQTQGKVGDTFGLIWLLSRTGKVGKVEI